jgi:hypothetical protein
LAAIGKLKQADAVRLSKLLTKLVELADVPRESVPLFFEEGPTLVRPKPRAGHARK